MSALSSLTSPSSCPHMYNLPTYQSNSTAPNATSAATGINHVILRHYNYTGRLQNRTIANTQNQISVSVAVFLFFSIFIILENLLVLVAVTDLRGEGGRGESMPTDQEPTFTVKLLQLILISTYWGMQIWVTFVSGFVMNNHLNRHTYGFIQSRLVPFYLHLGSACAFFNLTIYAVYHPSDMLDDREAFQIFIFFVSVTVSAVNAQWFGQMTSEIMADMHLIEQACGLGQDIGLSSNREAYAKLCETDVKYRHLSSRLWLYRLLSSLCNLCCIGCNFYSLCYMAENLVAL